MKNFNRVLAAAVAVPVALGQVLAISASAFNGAVTEVTTADVKYVKPDINFPTSVDKNATTITFTQESNWNEVLLTVRPLPLTQRQLQTHWAAATMLP